jgi:hypothetical protein
MVRAMAWLLERMRATVFAQDIPALRLPSWQGLTGARPVQILNPGPNTSLEMGLYGGYRLSISQEPGRTDLIAEAHPPMTTAPATAPTSLGELSVFLPRFMQITQKWISANVDVQRLALVCTIWEGTPTPEAALDIILAKVPSFKRNQSERIRDFLLQLNRPRQSQVNPALDINRLVQWSARLVGMISIPSNPWIPQPPMIPYSRAQADIDINTDQDSAISSHLILQHLDEMATLVLELAKHGDVP